MPLLTVKGQEELGLHKTVDDLQLFLTGMAGNVQTLALFVYHVSALTVQLVDDTGNGLFVAGDGGSGNNDPVTGNDVDVLVRRESHPVQGRHIFTLRAGRNDDYLVFRQTLGGSQVYDGAGRHFDVAKFGCDFAYTMDGGAIGELEYENFNAAGCKVKVHGVNVHPGYGYHKMINSMRIANHFATMLPRWETPEHTQGYEGFYHLIAMNGSVEETTLQYIIRDHDRARFESRKREIEHLARKINQEYGEGTVEVEIRDQYYNMREKVEPVMHIVTLVEEAMKEVGVTPKVQPIRGGTDGARLSFEGLPCPNIFAGGVNFHSRFEYLPIPSMQKAMEVILKIVQKA